MVQEDYKQPINEQTVVVSWWMAELVKESAVKWIEISDW